MQSASSQNQLDHHTIQLMAFELITGMNLRPNIRPSAGRFFTMFQCQLDVASRFSGCLIIGS
jgi:hypothetical protein